MLCTGMLASHKADADLYLMKGNACTQGRVRLLRWSDGSVRTAYSDETTGLSLEESYEALYSAAIKWNKRMTVLNSLPYQPRLAFIQELKKCISHSCAFEPNYQHREPGGTHGYRHDFIREYFVRYAWFEVCDEKFITNDHIIKRAKAYCTLVGVDTPRDSLIQRRLAYYWQSIVATPTNVPLEKN